MRQKTGLISLERKFKGAWLNVIIWHHPPNSIKPDYAYTCKRAILPGDSHFIFIKMNNEKIVYHNSCGMNIKELPKQTVPRDCKRISIDEANKINTNILGNPKMY